MAYLIVGSVRIDRPLIERIEPISRDGKKSSFHVQGKALEDNDVNLVKKIVGSLDRGQIINVVLEDDRGNQYAGAAKIEGVDLLKDSANQSLSFSTEISFTSDENPRAGPY